MVASFTQSLDWIAPARIAHELELAGSHVTVSSDDMHALSWSNVILVLTRSSLPTDSLESESHAGLAGTVVNAGSQSHIRWCHCACALQQSQRLYTP